MIIIFNNFLKVVLIIISKYCVSAHIGIRNICLELLILFLLQGSENVSDIHPEQDDRTKEQVAELAVDDTNVFLNDQLTDNLRVFVDETMPHKPQPESSNFPSLLNNTENHSNSSDNVYLNNQLGKILCISV